MPKFLTTEGLSKLLSNVKTVFATKTEVNTVVNEIKSPSNELGQTLVHTSGNETIAGTKIFSSTIAGSINGNSATSTKLANSRTISVGDLEFQGSAAFDGTGNINLNVTQHRCIVSNGNKNNYPFHRIAYTAVETANYIDRGITFFIGREYNNSGYGICRVILRTNNASNGELASCDVQWLVRTSGLPADTIQVGFNNTSGASYVDVFYKCSGTYASGICRVISHASSRAAVGRGFTVISSSNEASNTTATDPLTSTESYATIAAAGTAIRGKAYTSTITASDVGTVGSAAKATQDSDGSQINTTYLKLAGGKMTGDLKVQTSTANQLRLIQGNYGVLFRNDGGSFYILQTASGDAENGTWNSARPLTITLSTGVCNINGAAASATKDSAGQQINTTYIKALSVSGKTITYTKGNGTTGTITTQDTVYTHPTTAGNKHIPSGGSSGQFLKWSADGTATWAADNNTTYANFTKATASAAGKAGLVPAPAKGYQTRFLRGDATWQTVSTSSDRRVKQQFADIPDAVLDAWENIHWMQFKMNDEVKEKGSTAAIHTGLVVQDIQDIFTAKGLDANLYDMVSHEEWEASEEEKDEDGNVVVESSPAYEQWYLRYEQALAIEAAYQRRRADRLEARIAALEAKGD